MDGGGSHRALSGQSWPPPSTPMHKEKVLGMVARAGQSPGKAGVANCELHGFLAVPQYTHPSNGHKSASFQGGWQGLQERISLVVGTCLRVGSALSQAMCHHCRHRHPRVHEQCRVRPEPDRTAGVGTCSQRHTQGVWGLITARLLGY